MVRCLCNFLEEMEIMINMKKLIGKTSKLLAILLLFFLSFFEKNMIEQMTRYVDTRYERGGNSASLSDGVYVC